MSKNHSLTIIQQLATRKSATLLPEKEGILFCSSFYGKIKTLTKQDSGIRGI
jgi:hypothetical protein